MQAAPSFSQAALAASGLPMSAPPERLGEAQTASLSNARRPAVARRTTKTKTSKRFTSSSQKKAPPGAQDLRPVGHLAILTRAPRMAGRSLMTHYVARTYLLSSMRNGSLVALVEVALVDVVLRLAARSCPESSSTTMMFGHGHESVGDVGDRPHHVAHADGAEERDAPRRAPGRGGWRACRTGR